MQRRAKGQKGDLLGDEGASERERKMRTKEGEREPFCLADCSGLRALNPNQM